MSQLQQHWQHTPAIQQQHNTSTSHDTHTERPLPAPSSAAQRPQLVIKHKNTPNSTLPPQCGPVRLRYFRAHRLPPTDAPRSARSCAPPKGSISVEAEWRLLLTWWVHSRSVLLPGLVELRLSKGWRWWSRGKKGAGRQVSTAAGEPHHLAPHSHPFAFMTAVWQLHARPARTFPQLSS